VPLRRHKVAYVSEGVQPSVRMSEEQPMRCGGTVRSFLETVSAFIQNVGVYLVPDLRWQLEEGWLDFLRSKSDMISGNSQMVTQ
jgi:hypothetical protein